MNGGVLPVLSGMQRAFTLCLSACMTMLALWHPLLTAQTQPAAKSQAAVTQQSAPFKPEELEQIVAPIALYPDALLAQVLMASTYPLEIVQAARWAKAHPQVKGDAVAKETQKESWDPTVKLLVAFPDLLTMMSEKLDWTQKLGDAFLAQQKDLMDAVQRLRTKAKSAGNLKGSAELTVKTEPAPAGAPVTQNIIIESKNPEMVYVPTYDPAVVYGAWPYPAYPPYYYYPPGYVAGAALFTFTMGAIVGGALWGGCNWGRGDVDINVNRNNNFNRNEINANRNTGDRGNSGKWQHNPEHRKGAGYRDSATQSKYGHGSSQQGLQSREEFRGRAEQGRQEISREGVTNQRDLTGKQIGTREGGAAGSRDLAGGQTRDRGGSQSRDFSGSQPADRGGSQAHGASSSSRSRSSDAFSGVGNAASTRASSSRGGMSRGGGGGRRR